MRAHLLAALNHPNIAAIHGLEEADRKPFLVLELVEGENLKEYLARGAIPLNEALENAIQIAEALEEGTARASSTATSSPPTSSARSTAE